ncbi:hypothetical protein L521_2380 [Bordetella bronchiseptica MBORD698]|nr:hypothetical protein L521_2380 [Bordetella bronchiseptica MBORD698]
MQQLALQGQARAGRRRLLEDRGKIHGSIKKAVRGTFYHATNRLS